MTSSLFKNVKFRLTVYNLLVMVLIMAVTLSVVYVFMKKSIVRNAERSMIILSNNTKINPMFPRKSPSRAPANIYFSVRVDKAGTILEFSNSLNQSRESLQKLVNQALSTSRPKGVVTIDREESYRFLRHPQNGVIVFANTELEEEMLERLLLVLVTTGLVGIVLFILGSLFLSSKAIRPIKEAVEKQKTFVADASHELRTPLAVMQTNLELIQGNPDDSVMSQSKWIQNCLAENQRMTKLIDDLLTLARSDSGQLALDRTVFSITKLVQEVKDSFLPLAQEKNIELTTTLDEIHEFYADEARIRQLLVILVDNALKYTFDSGIVSVALINSPHAIHLFVKDNGMGIEKDHLDKIFERFYRADRARSRQNGGVGLGLSIADWIVKEHHGQIRVISEPGNGSIFEVILPKTAD